MLPFLGVGVIKGEVFAPTLLTLTCRISNKVEQSFSVSLSLLPSLFIQQQLILYSIEHKYSTMNSDDSTKGSNHPDEDLIDPVLCSGS